MVIRAGSRLRGQETEVIEHIVNSGAAFKHIHRILKQGGVLILADVIL